MEPCMTHTYALKSVRWHNYTDNTMLLQGGQPWISNPRVVILNDAYGEISPDAFAFVEDCYDRKITGTREQPAVFQKIRCFWDNMQFCIETELNLITYTMMTEDDDEVIFMPIAKRYGNGMQKQLIATDLFQSYETAERCVDAFLGATQAMHLFHRVDILVKCKRCIKYTITMTVHAQKENETCFRETNAVSHFPPHYERNTQKENRKTSLLTSLYM